MIKALLIVLLSLVISCCAGTSPAKDLQNTASGRDGADWGVIPMSVINTTDNTFIMDGKWSSTMGALTTKRFGLACDNTVSDMRFHHGDYRHWFVAPSDSPALLGMKKCSKDSQSEPSCIENWNLCGRKVRVKCLDDEFCGQSGEPSLIAQINDNNPPTNNYLPGGIVEDLTQALGKRPKVAKSVVLYITDFCPAEHSNNIKSRQCQRAQVDVSTPAFLLMGKTNPQGYINANVEVSVELLDSKDPTPVGPEY
ncbi:hypothetical protein Ga0123462_2090 [Mariprofundus ferrinatatus]|uniref:Uncharacterized protein n=1 Tax=Mariprofundus ferrinatatus TaxID=1921087 RepID=A0A2K8L6G4_9PROT|nr:hypothetical protein [Mariprofundus ferrinatatus]ATX82925.1 hypothetical protein Ga0123462_2090 [Mariprofundus ferrinatatus]